RWYNPADVTKVIAALVADLSNLRPAQTATFRTQASNYETTALSEYHGFISSIRSTYGGTPVGASESIFSMLAPALGLRVITPPSFLKAVSEGADVSSADKSLIDRQIRDHLIKVYIYNRQNATPDIQAQLAECRRAGIPTATITETLAPASASYQDWQVAQLRGIETALARGAGP
ncbi:MAG: metal ABC transporter solute-binding protein, Zn/Mn family, partial [Actinomycetes bacterium]